MIETGTLKPHTESTLQSETGPSAAGRKVRVRLSAGPVREKVRLDPVKFSRKNKGWSM